MPPIGGFIVVYHSLLLMYFVTFSRGPAHPEFATRDPKSYQEAEFDTREEAQEFYNQLLAEGIWDVSLN